MIKAPSQQFEYTLIFSEDPALNLPSVDAEREKALDVARETGLWEPLLHVGETPTLFHVRPIGGALLDWLAGEMSRRALSTPEACVLALRCALRSVEGFGDQKVKHERVDGFSLATMEIINSLYAIDRIVGRQIVQELGSIVLARAFEGLRPKS